MMNKFLLIAGILSFAIIIGCGSEQTTATDTLRDDSESPLAYSGGDATVFGKTSNVFFSPSPMLSGYNFLFHLQGDEAFENKFVAYPSPNNPGLGPIYVNVSCRNCHGRDGRGRPAQDNEQGVTDMLFRLSIPGVSSHGGPNPIPGFGDQLQNVAVAGVKPEGTMGISYSEMPGTFPDGEAYSLRKPTYRVINPYTSLPTNAMISPRVPSPVFGLGLLEAVSEETIKSFADENDADGDGISGRANYVWEEAAGKLSIGRFGWKANQPSLLQQTAGAYNADMGVTTPLFPIQACHDQPQCDGNTSVNLEVDNITLRANAHYVRTLGVPARRKIFDAQTQRGEKIFVEAKCGKCHIQEMKTAQFEDVQETANQTIRPYTDLLLHDMGDGLADNRPDFLATGKEWRTAPLWGVGLVQIVGGFEFFLHDGRARSLIEAIMWHGGEAQQSADFVKKLSKSQRDDLIAFLKSL